MNKEVDARGLACPLPVVNTKNAIATMKEGEKVSVLVDNEIAVQNLTKFAKQKGHTSVSEKESEELFRVTITVGKQESGSNESAPAEDEEVSCIIDGRQKGMVIVIPSNEMGGGEKELGMTLVKAFIFSLTKQDVLPEKIIFYNSGAFLSCEGSESLNDLKELEANGVEILTCGTCLSYYGLTEKLAVGKVTNMYDITENMEKATKLINIH